MAGFDVVVVGGGPGGYPAAIVAAKMGLRVAVVEDRGLGGECVLYGCVPSKALLAAYKGLRSVVLAGGEARLPLASALAHARSVANGSSRGLEDLMERLGVKVYAGRGRITPGGSVEVGEEKLEARLGVLYAPGSEPLHPSSWGVDNRRVLDNRGFFSSGLPEDASRVAIVGGSYVGVELAQALSLSGLEVTLFEAASRLLPSMERDLSIVARRALRRLGVTINTGRPVERIEPAGDTVAILSEGQRHNVDSAIVAVGRKPVNSEAVRAGADLGERGFVRVDECGRTSVSWLYVAGDAAGPPLLAHKAIHESLAALRCMTGGRPGMRGPIPLVVYGIVDLVSVGMSLEEARLRDPDAFEVRIPTGGFSTQRIHGVPDGFVKIVVSKQRIVGFHAAFPGAAEVAGEASLLVSLAPSIERIPEVVHPHPTMSESLWEAVMEALGSSVHVYRGRRR